MTERKVKIKEKKKFEFKLPKSRLVFILKNDVIIPLIFERCAPIQLLNRKQFREWLVEKKTKKKTKIPIFPLCN